MDLLERRLRQFGATHVVLTGLPLPHRPVNKLILRISWPDLRNDGYLLGLESGDAVLTRCLAARRSFVIRGGLVIDDDSEGTGRPNRIGPSELIDAAGSAATVVAIPIHDLHPFQGCIVIAGPAIELTAVERMALEYYCVAAFKRLQVTGRINGGRPGDLSERERRVLELTAIGKTASEIAELLEISQRTVHAHLQNASEKLNASNKTHTVVEALRYGQIAI
ncbi:helix-turn-helix transcriptional regulator [Prosthecomicrobium sp. N25]|uniref:helix-turn-helix transcriptional regulator n=1 Tax=Prosthecomicrobium sp. N25 TaxID=3129254 RepID=UPI00307730EA